MQIGVNDHSIDLQDDGVPLLKEMTNVLANDDEPNVVQVKHVEVLEQVHARINVS